MRTSTHDRDANNVENRNFRSFSGRALFLFAWLMIVGALANSSSAEEPTKPNLSFSTKDYTVTIPYGKTGTADLEVTVDPPADQEIVLTYEITSDELTADDIDPFGVASIVIPASSNKIMLSLSIKPSPTWISGIKDVQIKLISVSPEEAAEWGELTETRLTITRIPPRVFIPTIRTPSKWEQIDKGKGLMNVRSVAVCPVDESILYAGSDNGLFSWGGSDGWKPVKGSNNQNIPGSVREIKFGADCKHIYAAVLDSGVWHTEDGTNWKIIDPKPVGDALRSSITVELRENLLYTGTDSGVYYYDLGPGGGDSWSQVADLKDKSISRLTKTGDRIFAAIWTEGVAYNDSCFNAACAWTITAGPADDKFVREVIGGPPQNPGDSPSWMLFATATTIYRRDGQGWVLANPAPQPTGNVFSLVQDGEKIYAGTENSGVWVSINKGHAWEKISGLDATIRDMVIDKTGKLIVATFKNGVWAWR